MIGRKIIKFNTIDSTNNYIKQHLNQLSNGDVVWSLSQFQGRGRHGNTWMSKEGNLYFSFLLRKSTYINNLFALNMKVSVIIVKVLDSLGVKGLIKYPNDIIVNNRKISGILIETIGYDLYRDIIVGIGININQKDFYELNNKSTSLLLETNKKHDLEIVLDGFISLFNSKISQENIEKEYLKKSLIIGKYIDYNGAIYLVKKIYDNGKILLENSDNSIERDFNTISLKNIYDNIEDYV